MKTVFLLIGFLVGGLVASGAQSGDKVYSAAEAAKHLGETAVVTGRVDQIRKLDSGLTLMNLDGRYPEQVFTAVVRPADVEKIGDLTGLQGKQVRVHGKIIEYRGKPEIEISDRAAIEEVKK